MKQPFVYKILFYFFLFFLWSCNLFNNDLQIKNLENQAFPKDISIFRKVSSVWLLNIDQAKQIARPQKKIYSFSIFG